jgi:YD repeat-containing protein
MKHSIFFLFAFAFIIISCSKNNDAPTPPGGGNSPARLKTSMTDNGSTSYEYDSKGRITKSTTSTGEREEYVYGANTITTTEYAADNSILSIATIELNADGLITKRTYDNAPANSYLYFYNADKTIAKRVITQNGNTSVIDYFYTNGNFDSSRYKFNGDWNSTIVPTYYDKADGLSDEVYGLTYYGKSGKKLLKSESTRYDDGSTSTWNYAYDFDGKGRVTKRTSTNDQTVNVSYYTYY